jgi:hypothetical protein
MKRILDQLSEKELTKIKGVTNCYCLASNLSLGGSSSTVQSFNQRNQTSVTQMAFHTTTTPKSSSSWGWN